MNRLAFAKMVAAAGVVTAGVALGSGCSSSGSSSSGAGEDGGGNFGVTPSGDLISSAAGAGGTVWKVKWFMGTANENGDQGQMITIHKGDSVIWVTTDGAPQHTATEPNGVFDTGVFSAQSTALAFPNAGVWSYACSIHGASSMRGAITVK